jgi:adenine-specific DNA-methyltransferase
MSELTVNAGPKGQLAPFNGRPVASAVLERAEDKLLGRFYTPSNLAVAMTEWAIRSMTDRAIDPSYGGCAFFAAAADRLAELGAKAPMDQLYGVDIDRSAPKHLAALARSFGADSTLSENNFRTADFLSLSHRSFATGVNCILSNPPYVRHHRLTSDQIETARATLGAHADGLSYRASYWAYFVLHSLTFLSPGGRLAVVLPSAFLNADYAGPVRQALASQFRLVRVAVLKERVFRDAQESAVVVLADGFKETSRQTTLEVQESVESLLSWCRNDTKPDELPFALARDALDWRSHLIGESASDAFRKTIARTDCKRLGDLSRLRIGVVTGANKFFILSDDEVHALKLPTSVLRRIVSGSRQLPDLSLTEKAFDELRLSGRSVWLLAVPQSCRSAPVMEYTASSEATRAATAYHSRLRDPWYSISDLESPDAFLTYVNGRAPRIILNRANALCTNALHRIRWRGPLDVSAQRGLALSFLTSLSGLSAEISGRSTGGGALKLEPSDAKRVRLLVPPLGSAKVKEGWKEACAHLAAGAWDQARDVADTTILLGCGGVSRQTIKLLQQAQDQLHELRIASRR